MRDEAGGRRAAPPARGFDFVGDLRRFAKRAISQRGPDASDGARATLRGREPVKPCASEIGGVSVKTRAKWDGKDGELEVEEEFSLEDLGM